MSEDWYQTLELSPDASAEEIKRQYRFLCQVWYPDKFSNGQDKARAEEKMDKIEAAYRVLSDPQKRRDYDAGRGAPPGAPEQRPQQREEEYGRQERKQQQEAELKWRAEELRQSGNWYKILELSPDASQEEIKNQYRLLGQILDPDKFDNNRLKTRAEERLKEVNAAYEVLSDPRKRAVYDEQRQRREEEERGRWQEQQREEKRRQREGQRRQGAERVRLEEQQRQQEAKRKRQEEEFFQQKTEEKRQEKQQQASPPDPLMYPIATRWPRFFARTFDVWWEILVLFFLAFCLHAVAVTTPSSSMLHGLLEWMGGTKWFFFWMLMLCLPLAFILDTVIYSLFGNTPGKAFLGLKVGYLSNASPLSFGRYLARNLRVWMEGFAFGLGLSFVGLFMMVYQARRLGKGQQASYDQSADYRVRAKPIGGVRKCSFGVLFLVVFLVAKMIVGFGFGIAINRITDSPLVNNPPQAANNPPQTPLPELQRLQKAADQGNAYAQTSLGLMYQNGRGVAKDDSQAVAWYQKAADQGYAGAQHNLGCMYRDGRGVAKDDSQAVAWFQKAADQGYAKAQSNLGWMYVNGRGVAHDDRQAAQWYQKAGDQGNADAQNNLGSMYLNGRGVAQDDRQAVAWYQKAADQGNADAQNNLGFMYLNGRGVAKDDSQAVEWYQKAADQGYAKAQSNLGWMYVNGRGVAHDDRQVAQWYQKAGDQGNADAQTNLGWMYGNGRGVARDDTEAYALYTLAAENGNDIATKNKEAIRQKMTLAQISAGEQRANQLRQRIRLNHGKK